MRRLRSALGLVALSGMVAACESRSADEAPEPPSQPATNQAATPEPEIWDVAAFDGLDVVIDEGLRLEGQTLESALAPETDSHRVVIPELVSALEALPERATLAEGGVLVRAHPAASYARISQVIHTLATLQTPVTHIAVGDDEPVALTWEVPPDTVFVSASAKGVTITSGTELRPAVGDCPPGPTICLADHRALTAFAEQGADALQNARYADALENASKAAELFDVAGHRAELARIAAEQEGLKVYKFAAHPFMPASVLRGVLAANCVEPGGDTSRCDRHFESLVFTVLR